MEVDGAEWAPPGLRQPVGSAGPTVGHPAPIFRVLVVSCLCCLFVMCISPTLVFFVPVILVETKYAQKELCRFESRGVQELFIQI